MAENTLYICEKPSQARDIARILGCDDRDDGCLKNDKIVVTWCFGHLLETAEPIFYRADLKPWRLEVLPIIPNEWKWIVKEKCAKQFSIIKTLLANAKQVVIATDADREGELIAREILWLCKFKGGIKRLWLSALDDESIKNALNDLREGSDTEALYYAGLGRQRADWLIGMNLTMAASVAFGKYGEGVLSVGRVQTPTLKLIVDRDLAIATFKPIDYFEMLAQFSTNNLEAFYAKWQAPGSVCDEDGRVLNHNLLMTFAAKVRGKNAIVQSFENKPKQEAAPLCLSLSQLQKLASSKFGFSAAFTLEIAQSLYETYKATTYPRTDCGYLPNNQFKCSEAILNQLKNHADYDQIISAANANFKSSVWNDKKITAHHAIIPTLNDQVKVDKLPDAEKALYDLICRYFIAQFLGDYEFSERKVIVRCEGELFKASNHTPLKPGWKRALKNLAEKEERNINEELSPIPMLDLQQELTHVSEKIQKKQTRSPLHFTEGTLIEAMKSIGKMVQDHAFKKILKDTAGIGTEATRASIIELLYKRKYIERKGKHIVSTEKGKQLIASLPKLVSDPVLTAQWEQALDQVADGKLLLDAFMRDQIEILHQMVTLMREAASNSPQVKAEATDLTCPTCNKPLLLRYSKKQHLQFLGCSGYPNCSYTKPKENNERDNHIKSKQNNKDWEYDPGTKRSTYFGIYTK